MQIGVSWEYQTDPIVGGLLVDVMKSKSWNMNAVLLSVIDSAFHGYI